jgi:hypothetical protein
MISCDFHPLNSVLLHSTLFHHKSDITLVRCSLFVRDDELKHAWKLFDPLLEAIDNKSIPVHIYPRGSRGPPQGDQMVAALFAFLFFAISCLVVYGPQVASSGFVRNEKYSWK